MKYLIAHKVRGEAAFDIAEQMDMPDGIWWIIPTSGHRAYPFWSVELTDRFMSDADSCSLDFVASQMPVDIPDHYPVRVERASTVALATITLADLGL